MLLRRVGGVKAMISETTRSSYQAGGNVVEAATSTGGKVGQLAADAAASYVDEQIEELRQD